MRADVVHTVTERTVTLTVTDGPVLTKRYGRRQFRVDSVWLTYRQTDDGPWTPGGVDLAGPFVKKDGSDGVDRNRDHLWSSADVRAMPWLAELVDQHTPGGES